MRSCEIIPIDAAPALPACSGKCGKGGCASAPAVWVVAACEGMIALFEKFADGRLGLVRQGESVVSPSMEALREYLQHAMDAKRFGRLVLVGAVGDLSWMHSVLPEGVVKRVLAEIHYPLMPGWFRTSPDLAPLSQALERVVAA